MELPLARRFYGHEDDVLKGGQPNLFCNHYYWLSDEELLRRYPGKVSMCDESLAKGYTCYDSFYCNW